MAPVRIAVTVRETIEVRRNEKERRLRVSAEAEAELAPPGADGLAPFAAGGEYDGPLAYRQGEPMRPDVALAFDRMERAARAEGIQLAITSAFRTDAEQAELWRRNPDPKWVAPPGTSLHRYATELDLGPPSAYGWLAANAPRFHFVQRYEWEDWHYETPLAHNPPEKRAYPGTCSPPKRARGQCRNAGDASPAGRCPHARLGRRLQKSGRR